MSAIEKVAQDPEQENVRVYSIAPTDHHGIRPYPDGLKSGWCGHCHRTYDAARRCSLKRYPDVEVGGQ